MIDLLVVVVMLFADLDGSGNLSAGDPLLSGTVTACQVRESGPGVCRSFVVVDGHGSEALPAGLWRVSAVGANGCSGQALAPVDAGIASVVGLPIDIKCSAWLPMVAGSPE